MSKDNVKILFGKIEKDGELQKKYAAIMQEHQKESEKLLSDKLVELGRTSGLAFSKDDLLSARAELIDTLNANKELSANDLAKVAGGDMNIGMQKVGLVFLSGITIGIGCAIMSIVHAATESRQGGCAARMTTANCKDRTLPKSE